MTQKYQVKVSMKQAAIVETGIVLKQGDFGMQLEIEVLDFDATGTTPQIVFRKAMGAVESTTITASSNKYTYTFKGTELDTPGKVFCDLKLKNSTTQRISTASFMFKVVADTLDGLAEESSSYSDTIAQIVEGFDDDIEAVNDSLWKDVSNRQIVCTSTKVEYTVNNDYSVTVKLTDATGYKNSFYVYKGNASAGQYKIENNNPVTVSIPNWGSLVIDTENNIVKSIAEGNVKNGAYIPLAINHRGKIDGFLTLHKYACEYAGIQDAVAVVPDINYIKNDVLKDIGYYYTEYSVTSGSSHSGRNDTVSMPIKTGDMVYIYGGTTDLVRENNIVYAILNDDTAVHIGTFTYETQPLIYTIDRDDIAKIGISNGTASANANFKFEFFIKGSFAYNTENRVKKIYPDELPYIKEFTLSTSSHSATTDNVPMVVSANTTFYALVELENGQRVNAPIYGLKEDNSYVLIGTGYSNAIREITPEQNIKSFGVSLGALSSGTTTVKVIAYYPGTMAEMIYTDNRSNKPFYSRNYNEINADSKISTFIGLFDNDSTSVESFLFFTDPHTFAHGEYYAEPEMQKAMNTIEYAYNHAPVSNVLCGGDWLTSDDTKAEAMGKLAYIDGICRAKFGDHYYPMIGNHDTNYQGTGTLDNEAVTNLMFRRFGKNYYSFKGDQARFFVFDTGIDSDDTMTAYKWEQIAWFANQLIENTDEIIALGMHIFTNQFDKSDFDDQVVPFTFSDNITKVAQAFNVRTSITLNSNTYDFSNASGKISFCICGHTHYDADTVWNNIPVIISRNSTYTPNFDLCYADFINQKLYLIRVGDGTDREINIL